MMNSYDLLVISETHFSERIKCPLNFSFIGRSSKILSKKPRGGVALFKHKNFENSIEVICDSFRDCLVCRVSDTDIIIVAMYIPPSNSEYHDEIYMKNLDLIYNKFKSTHLIITGDLNSRVGSIVYKNTSIQHTANPDHTVNSNGRDLLHWINNNNDMILVNGLIHGDSTFDSTFTYYRGTLRSQNDIALSNNIQNIQSFRVLKNFFTQIIVLFQCVAQLYLNYP